MSNEQMPIKVHALKPDQCSHEQVDWYVDDAAGEFACSRCGQLMGDLDAGKPGWIDRLLSFWALRDEAARAEAAREKAA